MYYIHRNYAACLCPACATWVHAIIQSLLRWTLYTVTQERYPTRRPNSDRSTITDDSMRGNAALATCNKIGKPFVPWHFHMHHAYHIIIFYVQGYLKKGFKRGCLEGMCGGVILASESPMQHTNMSRMPCKFKAAVTYHDLNWSPQCRNW